MGGVRVSSFTPSPPPDEVLENIEKFFSAENKKSQQNYLIKAFNIHLRQTSKEHFVYRILSTGLPNGELELRNGLSGVEIESKLTVPSLENLDPNIPLPINREESLGELEKELLSWKLNPKNQDKFLKDEYAERDVGVNTYFGTEEREHFVVIHNDHGWYLKIKDNIPNYIEQDNGRQILRRREKLIKINVKPDDEDVMNIINSVVDACQPMAVRRLGDFGKEKVTQFILEKNSGRAYSLVLSRCYSSWNQRMHRLSQLEIEYVGHIPGFINKSSVENERSINADISYMSNFFQDKYGLIPTTLTKFQWLTGKGESTSGEENQVSLEGQSFFGKSV